MTDRPSPCCRAAGLRAGVQAPDPSLAVVHHMDHLLLGGKEQWRLLRPDCVLQLGGHLTSKRLCQFLEWCALPDGGGGGDAGSSSSDGSSGASAEPAQPACSWVFVDRLSQRHDQSWLLSHRVEAPAPLFAAAVAAAAPAPALGGSAAGAWSQRAYTGLLLELDKEVGRAVDQALAEMRELSEPHIARMLAQELPPGEPGRLEPSLPQEGA